MGYPRRQFRPERTHTTTDTASGAAPGTTVNLTAADFTEAKQNLAAGLQIRSIPTIMAFRDGVLLIAQPGALPAAAREELIGMIKVLDMDDVRAEIARAEAARATSIGV